MSQNGSATQLYVARQPILDLQGQVFGYELLYRLAAGDRSFRGDRDIASATVLTGALLDLGLDTLTGGRVAFLNLTRSILVGNIESLVPRDDVVIEILENVAIDDEVIETCRTLHDKGYRLALDDFVPGSDAEALLPYVAFVKVDVLATPDAEARSLARRLKPLGIGMLAEKVETRDMYRRMRTSGYSFFQGFYFCGPVLRAGTALPAQQLTYLRLLAALNDPNQSTTSIEALIKQDVSLTLRVLRSVNSAAHAIRTEIRSIGQALFLLGIEPIRRWASVWCLTALSANGTPELATLALVRARTCEIVGQALPDAQTSELFLVGLFSLLDVMLGIPMAAALENIPLSDDAKQALLGESNRLRTVLDAAIRYERGEWDEAIAAVSGVGVNPTTLAGAHTSALPWVQELMQ